MSDISKCIGHGCPKKNRCYRYTAPSNEFWQAYMGVPGYKEGRKWVCEYFWEIKPAKVLHKSKQ